MRFLLAIVLFCIACGARTADREEILIEATYERWVQITNARDIELWSEFLAPAAVVVPPGSPVLATEETIRSYYEASFADPNFSLDCAQRSVEIAESGDLAWARGTCDFTATGSDGSKVSGTSRWFKIWLKQPDGSWKCKLNTWNLGTN